MQEKRILCFWCGHDVTKEWDEDLTKMLEATCPKCDSRKFREVIISTNQPDPEIPES